MRNPRNPWLLHSIAWITARHLKHYEQMQRLVAQIGQTLMKGADPVTHAYYAESLLQREELHELKALSAAFDIKDMHTDELSGETDWPDHASVGLNMVASVLIEQHDWEPEEVGLFINDLSDGVFAFHSIDEYEEEE